MVSRSDSGVEWYSKNYVILNTQPEGSEPSNSKAIHNQNFSGKVNIAQSFIYAKQSVFIHINISHFNLSFTGG